MQTYETVVEIQQTLFTIVFNMYHKEERGFC